MVDHQEMPLGFSFALAQNPEAMQRFSALSQPERERILQKAHSVSSKREMQALVSELSAQS